MAGNIVKASFGAGGAGGVVNYLEDIRDAQGKVGYLGPKTTWLMSPETMQQFGLQGPVAERDALIALMEGRHPQTGEVIRQAGRDPGTGNPVYATHDYTCSPAPKSVSVLWALVGPGEQAAIEKAVKVSVATGIRSLGANTPLLRDRQGSEVKLTVARDLVASMTMHSTARPPQGEPMNRPDPNLHVHTMIMGAIDGQGRYRAIDSPSLLLQKTLMNARMSGVMAKQMYEMGFDLERTYDPKKGIGNQISWEIKGVPAELNAAMSRRSVDIAQLQKDFETLVGKAQGARWDAYKAEARNAKSQMDAVALRAAWAEIGKAHGLSPKEAGEFFTLATRRAARSLSADPHGIEAMEFEKAVSDRLCLNRAWVSPRQLASHTADQARGLIDEPAAMEVVARMVDRGELVVLPGGKVTTRGIVQLEQETIAAARTLAGRSDPGQRISEDWLSQAFEARSRAGKALDAGQRDAIEVALSGRRLVVVVGIPGSGKGSASKVMVEGWHHQGKTVVATSIAGATAVRAKKDSGADHGWSVAGLLERERVGKLALDRDHVLLVDEAGMLDHANMHSLTRLAERSGATLVLVGDHRQVQPIGPGGMFPVLSGIAAQDDGLAELRENHRAHDSAEAAAWLDLREGRYLDAARHWQAEGRFILHDSKPAMYAAMAQRWFAEGQKGSMLVSSSNADRDALNQLAQQLRIEAGELGTDSLAVRSGQEVRGGDRVLFNEITHLPKEPVEVKVPERTQRLRNGEMVTTVIRMKEPPRVENGTMATVEEVDRRAGAVALRLHEPGIEEGQERVVILPAETAAVDLGYASHVVKGQGITVESHGQAVVEPGMSLEALSVAVSRGREGAVLNAVRPPVNERGVVDLAQETGAVDSTSRTGRSAAEADDLAQLATVVRRVAEEAQARRDLGEVREDAKTAALGCEPGPEDLTPAELASALRSGDLGELDLTAESWATEGEMQAVEQEANVEPEPEIAPVEVLDQEQDVEPMVDQAPEPDVEAPGAGRSRDLALMLSDQSPGSELAGEREAAGAGVEK